MAFRPGYSCLHTTFILQEAIQHAREKNRKLTLPSSMSRRHLTPYGMRAFLLNYTKRGSQREYGTCFATGTGTPHALFCGIKAPPPFPSIRVSDKGPSSPPSFIQSLLINSLIYSLPQDLESPGPRRDAHGNGT